MYLILHCQRPSYNKYVGGGGKSVGLQNQEVSLLNSRTGIQKKAVKKVKQRNLQKYQSHFCFYTKTVTKI